MKIDPGEHPVSLQLFGSDPEILGQIAAQIEERPFDILDFNMGCPVPKVVNNGEVLGPYEGSASGEGNRDKHGKGSEKACNRKDSKGL